MLLGVALLGAGCATTTRESPPQPAVGHIVDVDDNHSFVIAAFPEGRRLIHVDMRQLAHYRAGDEIRLDQAGRPLPPR
jgi:hypothetical protein